MKRTRRQPTAGFWVPKRHAERTAPSPVGVFVPHGVPFPDSADDFAEFKGVVRSLSRTDTLLWCARLNLMLGFSDLIDPVEVQRRSAVYFFTREEIARLNEFARAHHARVTLFFRGQLLELMRWVTLLSTDHPDDGTTFDDASVRREFARACLMASDLWARRVYPDSLDLGGDVRGARRRLLAGLRRSHVDNSVGLHPLVMLGRGAALADAFPSSGSRRRGSIS